VAVVDQLTARGGTATRATSGSRPAVVSGEERGITGSDGVERAVLASVLAAIEEARRLGYGVVAESGARGSAGPPPAVVRRPGRRPSRGPRWCRVKRERSRGVAA